MLKKLNYFLPTLSQSWVIVFYLIFVGSIFAAPATLILNKENSDISMVISYILIFIPPLIYILIKSKIAYERGETKPVAIEATNLGGVNRFAFLALCAVVTLSLTVVLEPLTSWIPMSDSVRKMFEELMNSGASSFVAAAILAPILEEFFLRGVIARGLFYNGSPLRAILWSSAIFAIIHLNPWQGVGAFIIGTFLGWIYWRTHSLLAVIFIHFVNNASAVVASHLIPNNDVELTLSDLLTRYNAQGYYIPIYIISLALIAISIYFLNKRLPKQSFNNLKPINE